MPDKIKMTVQEAVDLILERLSREIEEYQSSKLHLTMDEFANIKGLKYAKHIIELWWSAREKSIVTDTVKIDPMELKFIMVDEKDIEHTTGESK